MPSQCQSNGVEILGLVSQVVTWLIVFFGWVIVDRQHHNREERKEVRAALDTLEKMLDDLELKSIEFHQAALFDKKEAGRIQSSIQRVQSRIRRLPFGQDQDVNTGIIEIRRAITLRNFEVSSFTSQPEDGEISVTVSASRDFLMNVLDEQFKARFSKKWRI